VHLQAINKDYRADIDGLRSVAVLSVLFYHIDSSILPGGYTGVDVFFIISGFLISSHIFYEINHKNNFSFKKFYLRRIKRILPALLFMTIAVIVAGFFIFTNFYFQSLGEQAFATTLSYSNIYFYFTSSYFDVDASLKPLLHTWSLGVEEQFYLVWPAIIVAMSLFSKKAKKLVVGLFIILIISFLFNGLFSQDLNAIFYLMPFRMFEFSVGAIIAVLLQNDSTERASDNNIFVNLISLFGLLLIIAPMFYLTDRSVFPYYNAIPTVIGSGILLYYRRGIVNQALSLRPLVFIGLISYSLYLYHWPVIVFTKYQFSDLSNTNYYGIVISVSFILAILSYHLIEKPFRFSKNVYMPWLFSLLFLSTLTVSYAVKENSITSFYQSQELVPRNWKDVKYERYVELNRDGCNLQFAKMDKNCDWEAETQILFFGNSHSIDSYNMFDMFLGDSPGYNLIYVPHTWDCRWTEKPKGIVESENAECLYAAGKLSSKTFLENIDVLVVSFFEMDTRGARYLPMIDEMRKKNPDIQIIMMGGFIGVRPNYCSELINKLGDYGACKDEKYVTYWGGDEEDFLMSKDFTKRNYLYVDKISILCGPGRSLKDCKMRTEEELLFYDGDHFSLSGAHYFGKLLADRYREQLNSMGIYY